MVKLLSPAGDLQKLKYAIVYGADAVYLGGKNFGMRSNAGNFSDHDIQKGIAFAHEHGAMVHVTMNIAVHNSDFPEIIEYTRRLRQFGVDGLIISDPGLIELVKNESPDFFLTLSTQANTTNYESLKFWRRNGIDRVVLARELSFEEIKEICKNKPQGMQIEVFVHGAMCISYSGRCLLSHYMANRDANRGDCAQPCRWKYSLVEKNRPGQQYDIIDNGKETFLFNSKDLCLIEHVKDLIDIGVDCFKIEGRMKSSYYVATITNAYRIAIERALSGGEYSWGDLYEEVRKVSHRQYTTAFFNGIDASAQNYDYGSYTRTYDFIAEITSDTDENGYTEIRQRNKFGLGEWVEVMSPKQQEVKVKITEIKDDEGNERETAPHPDERLIIKTDPAVNMKQYDIIRRKCLQ